MGDAPGRSPDVPDPGPQPGQLLDGRYLVGELLGAGGMSSVHHGRHLALDRPCAIKLIHPARAADPEARARFEREATAASRVSHPNVCRIYDFGCTAGGPCYLVLEYLEGQTLAAALERGPLGTDRALAIARQCAAGLQAAHDAGVVHRDLKAANVMLTPRDGGEAAVIVDFGIARTADAGALTRDGLMVGTPEVMSPEQIAGDPVGPPSDQYQLALLLVRMLTGALPFPGGSTQERMTRRLTHAPEPLSALAPGRPMPPGAQAALDRALSRRPDERFPSVAAFVAALDAPAVPGRAAHSAPTEVLARPAAATRRPAWPLVVAGGALVAAVGLWAYGDQWRNHPELPVAERPEADTPAPAPPPAAPNPVPPAPATAPSPTLPAEERVFSDDPAERRLAREQAERVYRSSGTADTVRAEAAFLIAETHRREGEVEAARLWLQRCLDLQERAGCRRLLRQLP